MTLRCLFVVFLALGGTPPEAAAQETRRNGPPDSASADSPRAGPSGHGPFYYKGRSFGHEAYAGPLDVILNQGFALAQAENRNRRIFDYDYGFASVADAVSHPVRAIRRGGGWWQFVRREILPFGIGQDSKWFTNYTGHFLEGGIHYRRLTEWFDAHGVPLAPFLAGVINMGASYLNEVYENENRDIGTSGTVADLMFWDILGVVAFAYEPVARFFARELQANVWTDQASLVFPGTELQNMGSHLVLKFPIHPFPRTSMFFNAGITTQAGITLHREDGLDVSVAFGFDARAMHVDPVTGEDTAELRASGSAFVDREGSLLAQIHLSQLEDRMLTVNIYPGVLAASSSLLGSFGGWVTLTRDLHVRFGLSNRFWLGLGFGATTQ